MTVEQLRYVIQCQEQRILDLTDETRKLNALYHVVLEKSRKVEEENLDANKRATREMQQRRLLEVKVAVQEDKIKHQAAQLSVNDGISNKTF